MGIDQKRLKELITYDPLTGDIVRVVPGKPVSHRLNSHGYPVIQLDGKKYLQHRMAFLYMEGNLPSSVDHINGIKSDNSWVNLRAATSQQNNMNRRRGLENTSGVKGVYFHKARGKWAAQLKLNGEGMYLGIFKTREEAASVIRAARLKYHGEYVCHG